MEVSNGGVRLIRCLILHYGTSLRPTPGFLKQVHEVDVAGLKNFNYDRREYVKVSEYSGPQRFADGLLIRENVRKTT